MRDRVIFAIIATMFVAVSTLAQGVDTCWVRRFNNTGSGWDEAGAVTIDHNGNTIVVGMSGACTVIKYTPAGDTAWMRSLGIGVHLEGSTDIAVDGAGNIYIPGITGPYSFINMAVVKLLPNGDLGWMKTNLRSGSHFDRTFSVKIDANNDVFVLGKIDRHSGGSDATIVKYNSDGDTIWASSFNSTGLAFETLTDIALDTIGGIYAAGTHGSSSAGPYAYLVLRYYPNGELAWYRTYDSSPSGCSSNPNDSVTAIAADNQGNVYVTGTTGATGPNPICSDYCTIKYDSLGNQYWIRQYNGTSDRDDFAIDIVVPQTGYIYVAGTGNNANTGYDIAVVKYNPEGDLIAVHTYTGTGEPDYHSDEYASAIATDSRGSIFVAGTGQGDYVTLKYYPDGFNGWMIRYDGPANNLDYCQDVAIGDSGMVAVTGWSHGIGTGLDYATIRYKERPVFYIPGDANATDNFNGLDIVFCVNYFKGLGPAPSYLLDCPPHYPIYAAADINGNCRFDGLDVTYGVNYLKGIGPAPAYCPDCPPEGN